MSLSDRLLITELAATQSNRSVTVNEAIAKLEAGVSCFTAVSLGDNSPPVSPVARDGDVYVLGTSPTGAWAGHSREIAIFHNDAWFFLPAIYGMLAYAQDEGVYYYFLGSSSPGTWTALSLPPAASGAIYDFGAAFEDAPGPGDVITRVHIGRNIIIPANFSGGSSEVDVNPAATFDVDVRDDGVSIGTISISTGGVATLTTVSGTSKSVAAGSVVTFVSPANSPAEATVAGFSAIILATVA